MTVSKDVISDGTVATASLYHCNHAILQLHNLAYHSHVNILQLIAAPYLSALVIDIVPTLT